MLVQLFLVFFKIGLFAIGGAYSFLPLIQKDVVDRYQWLTKEEFLEVLGIVKVFPGAISIKFATYTGFKMAGVPGVVVANVANLLAPVILVMAATFLYSRYKETAHVQHAFQAVQFAIFALILGVALQSVNLAEIARVKNMFIVLAAFFLFFCVNIHPAFIIIGAGIFGVLLGR